MKIEEFEVKFTPSTSEKRVKRNPKKYQKKNFVYSDHGQILKVNGRITSQTKVICNYCQLELSYPSFKNHYVSLHLQSAVFSCEECDKPFNRRSRLNEHKILAHTVLDNSAFPCQLCGESFPIRSALTTHILKMHKKPKKVQKKYACDVPGCPKKFRSSNNLKTHYNVEHLKIKQHPCLFCERGQFLT